MVWCKQAVTPLENYEGTIHCETNSSLLTNSMTPRLEVEDGKTRLDVDIDTYINQEIVMKILRYFSYIGVV